MSKIRLLLVAATAALVASLALTATASAAPKLTVGIYDCMAYNYTSGFLDYKGSVKLKARNRYEHGFGRKKRTIEDKTRGTYKIKGAKVTFSKGALTKTKAKIEKGKTRGMKPFFSLLLKGKPSGISCYYVKKP